MSGRTGWAARWTLRLGLLLGGVAVVWGAHEVASGSAAHAADREPSGPLTATVGVLTHTLGAVLGLPASGTDDGGTAPAGSGDAAAEAPAPARPAPGPDSAAPAPASDSAAPTTAPDAAAPKPGTAVPGTPVTVTTAPGTGRPKAQPAPATPVTGRVVEAVVTPVHDHVLAPVTDGLRPVTDPVRDHLLAPAADGLRPVTDPVQVGVLDPVADVLSPAVEPLRPILGPVWRGLEPVLDPLEPVLDPLGPVTDLLEPPDAPAPGSPLAPGEPVPGPAAPGVPADLADLADPVAGPAPAPERAHGTPQRLVGPVLATPAGRTAVGTRWVDPARDRTPSAAGPPENVTTTPALPPLDGVTHGGGAVHSEAADADANRWRLPTPAHGYARPAADPLPPSRTSRPGTRPA